MLMQYVCVGLKGVNEYFPTWGSVVQLSECSIVLLFYLTELPGKNYCKFFQNNSSCKLLWRRFLLWCKKRKKVEIYFGLIPVLSKGHIHVIKCHSNLINKWAQLVKLYWNISRCIWHTEQIDTYQCGCKWFKSPTCKRQNGKLCISYGNKEAVVIEVKEIKNKNEVR